MNALGRCLQRLNLCAFHPSNIIIATPASSLIHNAVRPSSSSSRQSKILRKLVAGKDKAKRRWYQDGPTTPKLQSAASLSNPARQGKNAPRRVHVLNKLFMKHITDLMSTGETSDAILGRGLQISHVKVSADFNYVNVFWSATHAAAVDARRGAAADGDLEAVLRHIAGQLRHELSQLRLMGEVPRINFVRNRQVASDAAIDALLARADFGDDYEPIGWAQMRQDLVPQHSTSGALLPPMRHDVLGVNQAEIMGKIRQTMAKSRQAWERYTEAEATNASTEESHRSVRDDGVPQSVSISEVRAEIAEETRVRDEEFAKFLEQRRRARKRRSVKKNPDFNESYFREEYDDCAGDYGERFDQGVDFIEDDAPSK